MTRESEGDRHERTSEARVRSYVLASLARQDSALVIALAALHSLFTWLFGLGREAYTEATCHVGHRLRCAAQLYTPGFADSSCAIVPLAVALVKNGITDHSPSMNLPASPRARPWRRRGRSVKLSVQFQGGLASRQFTVQIGRAHV